jgi:hypothetical protein
MLLVDISCACFDSTRLPFGEVPTAYEPQVAAQLLAADEENALAIGEECIQRIDDTPAVKGLVEGIIGEIEEIIMGHSILIE